MKKLQVGDRVKGRVHGKLIKGMVLDLLDLGETLWLGNLNIETRFGQLPLFEARKFKIDKKKR